MGTNADKHRRQGANRNRLEQARRRARSQSRRRRVISVVAAVAGVAIILGGVLSMTLTGGGTDDGTDSSASSTTTEASGADLPRPAEGVTLTEPTPCPPATGSARRVERFAGPPPTCIDPEAAYTATFDTDRGSFTATLDPSAAPVSVNNFVVLARYHYYDGVPFHRIVPDFVIQAGDGDGAPWGQNDLGYTIGEEPPASTSAYVDYSLAMAKTSEPNSTGSQFFIVLPGGGAQLQPPSYSLFGQVTQGQDVVDRIASLGDPSSPDGAPKEAAVIRTVTIDEQAP